MFIHEMTTIEQVEKQLRFTGNKIQSLFNRLGRLNRKKSELIKESNSCQKFNPLKSTIERLGHFHSQNCQDCGHTELEHKIK